MKPLRFDTGTPFIIVSYEKGFPYKAAQQQERCQPLATAFR